MNVKKLLGTEMSVVGKLGECRIGVALLAGEPGNLPGVLHGIGVV